MAASDIHAETATGEAAPDANGVLVPVNNRVQLPTLQWPHAVATRPEILTARANPAELLHALRRRWILAVGLGMALAGLFAGLVWFFVPVRYEAMSLVRISKRAPRVFQEVGGTSDDFDTYKRTQLQLIRSNFVLNATLRNPEIAKLSLIQTHREDPIGWLDQQLVVDYPGDAELLRVAMKGNKPDQLMKIVNAVVQAYMDEIVNAEVQERLQQRDTLERNYTKNREEIRKKAEAFHRLAKQLGTTSSETAQIKKRLALQHLDMLISQRTRGMEHLRELDLKIVLLKARQPKSESSPKVPDYLFEAELNRDAQISQAKARILQLRAALREEQERSSRENAPSVKRLTKMLTELGEEIEERKAELLPQIIDHLSTNGTPADSTAYALPLLETERSTNADSLEALNEELAAHTEEVQKLEQNSSELEARKAELEELNLITGQMGRELRLWEIELNATPRIKLAEKATIPAGNDALRKFTGVMFASFAGFALAVFGVATLEFQARRVNRGSDIRDGLGLRVIGELPSLSPRVWQKIQGGKSGAGILRATLAEAIDSIRTTLLHNSEVESPRMVMITSADPQEGKTTVATQLAASMARSGRRTLLIDGDLRSPAAHRVFELPKEPGLCDVLRGTASREAVIHPTRTANLWLIPAGSCCMQSVQALSHSALNELLAALKAQFDFVIIDSGPVLKIADPLLIGQHVDAAVISVLRDMSKTPHVYEASERLRSVGITLLGAVINGINNQGRRYSSATSLIENDTNA